MLHSFKNNHFKKFAIRSGIRSMKKICLWFCLLFFTTVTVVDGYDKSPDGDGSDSATGNAETLRRAVSDWIAAGGASSSTVVAMYGPIEDWDVSEVTNMKYIFFGQNLASTFGSFNEDLSKWNTSAVTTMYGSKCTFRCCVF